MNAFEGGPDGNALQGCVVVGAGGGIGAATSRLLAARGFAVVCADADVEAAERTAEQICAAGGSAAHRYVDVTEYETLDRAFAFAVDMLGQVHAVVNCAGIQGRLGVRSHEVTVEDLDRAYAVNLRGALAVSKMAIPHMLRNGYGRIAHVASIAGKEGNPNMVCYAATKAAVIGMVKAQAKEYAQDGIVINALAPAAIRTPFLDSQPPDVVAYMAQKIPMNRLGTTAEAAELLCWMVSPACSFTTGFTFDLSGGRATY